MASDPIAFPRRYSDAHDIEVAAWIAATLAYGRVAGFQSCIEKILSLCGSSPHRYLMSFQPEREHSRFRGIGYRFTRSGDLFSFLCLASRILRKYGTMGRLFASLYRREEADAGPTLSRFVSALRAELAVISGTQLTRGLRHLLPTPKDGSACKRLNLYLRWMVRPDDGLDFGLWKDIPASKLLIPLDTHVARISGYLGLSHRKTGNWKMAREITSALRKIDPQDPLRFDFPLCHLGISGDCPPEPRREKCRACPLQAACSRGRAFF